eukprot:c45481_g1_i1.p1 GENE.c45481_g1_i1~~c45481_g1_i1.p1  ORF type:complete len:832 (+),score=132.61 c45481_g1_i1:37-2532(+)
MLGWAVFALLWAGLASAPIGSENNSYDEQWAQGTSLPQDSVALLEQYGAVTFNPRTCSNVGDTHTTAFDGTYFDVMGEEEWILAEGPRNDPGTPHWMVQAYQNVWNGCGRSAIDVTVMKELAVKCGDWTALLVSPQLVSGCNGGGTMQYIRFFLLGTGSDGTKYNGKDIYPTMPNWINMPNGNIEIVGGNKPMPNGSPSNSGNFNLVMKIRCQDTEAEGQVYKYTDGSFMQIYVRIPDGANTNAKIRCGANGVRNLQSGYCGCWQGGSLWDQVNNNREACRRISRNFYDPDGNRGCKSSYFVPSLDNSIFEKFQTLTYLNKFDVKYTTRRKPYIDAATTVNSIDAKTIADRLCKNLILNTLGYTPDWNKISDPRIAVANTQLAMCIDDSSNGLVWSQDILNDAYCVAAKDFINAERRDVFCALKLLDTAKQFENPNWGDFSTLLSVAKTPQEITDLINRDEAVRKLAGEVASSLANIEFWYTKTCDKYFTPITTELTNFNCAALTFTDSSAPLKCDEVPPVVNAKWSGSCTAREVGNLCTVRCDPDATGFPDRQVVTTQLKCALLKKSSGNPKQFTNWETTNNVQCCKGTCTHPTKELSGCERGANTCADCASGFFNNAQKCALRDCPVNSAGAPTCKCNSGYAGTLAWSRDQGVWTGTCTLAACPANADGGPNCKCKAGFAGTLAWNANTNLWTGTCSACVTGQGYAPTIGMPQCSVCSPCDSTSEIEKTPCTSTVNRVCECRPGYERRDGKCQTCVQKPGQIVNYKDVSGDQACRACVICNTQTEVTLRTCTPTSNAACEFVGNTLTYAKMTVDQRLAWAQARLQHNNA